MERVIEERDERIDQLRQELFARRQELQDTYIPPGWVVLQEGGQEYHASMTTTATTRLPG